MSTTGNKKISSEKSFDLFNVEREINECISVQFYTTIKFFILSLMPFKSFRNSQMRFSSRCGMSECVKLLWKSECFYNFKRHFPLDCSMKFNHFVEMIIRWPFIACFHYMHIVITLNIIGSPSNREAKLLHPKPYDLP